jgi:hypothetical protein
MSKIDSTKSMFYKFLHYLSKKLKSINRRGRKDIAQRSQRILNILCALCVFFPSRISGRSFAYLAVKITYYTNFHRDKKKDASGRSILFTN